MKTWRETPMMGVWFPLITGGVLLLAGLGVAVMSAFNPDGALYLSVPILVASSLFLSFAQYRYQDNKALYAKLYDACPELRGNLSLLADQADYWDEGLQVLLYRNFLVTTYDGLRPYAMADVVWVYHHIYGARAASSNNLMIGVVIKERHLLKEMPLRAVVDETVERVEALLAYLGKTYPRVMIGYTPANNQFFGILREENKGKPKRFWDFLF